MSRVVAEARSSGYDYVRLDTNGQFPESCLADGGLVNLDELAFSLDGYDATTNDPLRGSGTFDRALLNIERSLVRGMKVTITCCIHSGLVQRGTDGIYGVETMIRFAESLGVHTVNFHDLFKDVFTLKGLPHM